MSASISYAESVTFDFSMVVDEPATGEVLGIAACMVNQTLEWENKQAVWTCEFNQGESQTSIFDATSLGYIYDDSVAFSTYLLNAKSDLGKFFLSGLELGDLKLKGVGELKAKFFEDHVGLTSKIMFVDEEKQVPVRFQFTFLRYED